MTTNEKAPIGQCRLDLWLWAARFYKTRNLAALNIKKGLVSLSGKTTTKPASILNIGSHLVVDLNSVRITILVEKIAQNETIISVSMEEQNEEFIQEIISQINQMLS